MIEVTGLTKYYGLLPAVRDISFCVERGEILGFLGPNGAGKTTTMRILTCFIPPTSGQVRVAGYDIYKDPLEVRRRIGYLPESVPLYGDMTVSSYLLFVAEIKGIKRRERHRRVEEAVRDCGIAEVRNRLIGRLSKGYRQRVGIAQALLGDPEVLILDEPTIGLDPKQIIEIRNLIKGLGGQRTVILSTHILPEVSMVCQRVVIINEGRLVAVDTPENLTTQLQKTQQVYLQVEGPPDRILKELEKVNGVLQVEGQGCAGNGVYRYLVKSTPDMDIRKNLATIVYQNHWGLWELRPVSMTLEDIFIKLVTEEVNGK